MGEHIRSPEALIRRKLKDPIDRARLTDRWHADQRQKVIAACQSCDEHGFQHDPRYGPDNRPIQCPHPTKTDHP